MNTKELSEDMFKQATKEAKGAREILDNYLNDASTFRSPHCLCQVQERVNLGEELFLRADQLRITAEKEKEKNVR